MPAGTVLFSSRAPVGYVAIAANPVCTNQGFKSFVLRPDLLPDYIYYYLQRAKELVLSLASGTTFLEVSGARARGIPFALAPLPEQQRIVAAIETQFTRLDAAVAALERVRANLKRYRASVLKAGLNGYAYPAEQHTLGDLAVLITSGSRGWARYYFETGPVFVRAQDINTDRLRLDSIARVRLPEGAEGTRTRVQPGDLLITITGANVTKTALVTHGIGEAYVSQHVALVRLKDHSNAKFIHYFLTSPAHARKVLEKMAYGAGKPGLNLSQLRGLLIDLPTPSDQNALTMALERKLSVLDTVETAVSSRLKRASLLRQSILKRAFEGKLVPQDPDDEPASVLLDRIRSDRQSATGRGTASGPGRRGRSRKVETASRSLIEVTT